MTHLALGELLELLLQAVARQAIGILWKNFTQARGRRGTLRSNLTTTPCMTTPFEICFMAFLTTSPQAAMLASVAMASAAASVARASQAFGKWLLMLTQARRSRLKQGLWLQAYPTTTPRSKRARPTNSCVLKLICLTALLA